MVPEDFKPRRDDPMYFRQDVRVIGMGSSMPISPLYCATQLTALVICQIFADLKPKIVMDYPQAGWPVTNDFFQSALVPWIEFAGLPRQNAGQLAEGFTHGLPPDLIEKWTREGLESLR